jgi:excinuclease UvrABC helicase subunit UvrB
MPQMKMKSCHLLENLILKQMTITMRAMSISMQRAKKKRWLQLKFNKSLHIMLRPQSRRATKMMILKKNRTIRRKTPRNLQA